jgi:hypothetical protein
MCLTGAKLVQIPGSVCAGCYALKGNYVRFNKVQKALERRAASITDPDWVDAMVALVTGHEYFRWHDSGDLQSVDHLKNIFEVCKRTPSTKHWMPTREARFLKLMDPDIIPPNLIIRMSSHMINQKPVYLLALDKSTVSTQGKTCPAADQGNKCRDCRACWDRKVSQCHISETLEPYHGGAHAT